MNAAAESVIQIPRKELLQLCAADSVFYCKQFFPKTFRQDTPEFHRDFWTKFRDPSYDFFAAEIFRGGAKTTLARAGISQRIAYAISRHILVIAISEHMAIFTLRWLKKQIETNVYWTETFGLRKGSKWTDDWIEIVNVPFECNISLVAKGMTSGLRGLNLDDYRPDLIFCDDISNEETVGTPEQRIKNAELFFGAVVPSLAPKSEAPLRKLVLAQTGLHKEDIINQAHNDPTFQTVRYPKLVETELGEPRSAWESRYPTEEVLKERDDYTRRNQFHIWLRECGCKIVSRETAPLDGAWLRYWKSLPTDLDYYVGLDPAISKKKNAHRTAGAVVGVSRGMGDVYLVEYFAQVGKNPDEMWVWLLRVYLQYRPRKVGTETIAFQKFLAFYFRQKMLESKVFFVLDEVQDKRPKPDRIIQAYSGIASQGKFWVSENHVEFIQGFTDWTEEVDWDLGDAGAQAITLANPWMAQSYIDGDTVDVDYAVLEKDIPDLVFEGGAP